MSGKSKALKKAAEAAGLLKQAEALPKAADIVGKGDLGLGVADQVARQVDEAGAVARDNLIFNPDQASVRYDVQHTTPEEFQRRLREQLVDPQYSNRAISDVDAAGVYTDDIKMAYLEDADFQERAGKALRTNPRVAARAKEWSKDSPYIDPETGQPRIFVHVDRQSDPTERGRLVQFDEPRELGVHSGTNNAAIQATIKDPDIGLEQLQRFDAELEELAGFTESPEGFLGFFAQTLDDYLVSKFSRGMDVADPTLWDDLHEELTTILLDLGADTSLASQYVARAKQLPTANSTPHLFRGKNGLYLEDTGGFGRGQVGNQLKNIFPEDEDLIDIAMSGPSVQANKNLQKFIESKGYDHALYHNAVEDKGTLSIINWNEDLWVPLLDEKIVGTAPAAYSQQATSYILGMLGLGAGVQRGKDDG